MQFILKILTIVFAINLAACVTDGESYIEPWSIANGAKVPNFNVITWDGTHFSSVDLSGQRAVILFFNTDCGDCHRELPKMQSVYEKTLDEFLWIAIGREQNANKAALFWDENNLTIPYSAQPDRKVYNLFAFEGIPRVYIVDDLTIVAQLSPDQLQGTDELIKTLKAFVR